MQVHAFLHLKVVGISKKSGWIFGVVFEFENQ